jgi:AraC-like DNA-binding protein
MKNQIHIDRDYGWFIGGFDNNQKHKHYAIQLSIPLEHSIVIATSEMTIESEHPVLIQSNVVHQIVSGSRHFLLLINPASSIGHFWHHMITQEIQEVKFAPAKDLKRILTISASQPTPVAELNGIIKKYDCFCNSSVHKGDERINKALGYLSENFERIVALEEISDHCHLSPSRFLHLFREETGISFRRAQLWNKLIKGLPYFGKKNLTEIAHKVGFSDSAHLSRIFKENFGFSPREFLKISQFIQV